MNASPLVSIVTPSLNQGRFIRETIESVLSQNYPNLEYWVIDGGSTDETLDILRSYGNRLHWISEPDSGQSQAINKGWRLSQGTILGWLNADDTLQPGAVRHAVEAILAKQAVGAVYGKTDYIDETGKIIQPYPARIFDYEALVRDTEDFIPQPSVFIRRTVLEKTGYLNESLHYVMDYDLWLRLGMVTELEYLPIGMATLRLHAAAKTVKAMSKFAHEFEFIFHSLFSNPAVPASLQQNQRKIMHMVHTHCASFCFWGGETNMALQYLKKAWTLQPFPPRRTFWLLLAFSCLGRVGWKLAEFLHGNPMHLDRGPLSR